jgi:DMSO/TMAO reductase YedYZ molybdopterin-dependent catalytic subunit
MAEMRVPLAEMRQDTHPEADGLVATDPAPATVSRRGALAIVGGSAATVFVATAGQTLGGPLRETALLAPRGRDYGNGPNDFQVNKPAASVGVTAEQAGPSWRLELRGGPQERTLTRDDLLAMEQHTYDLPIACVEGWSTVQRWTGVRLRDLAALAGTPGARELFAESLQKRGAFSSTSFSADQVDAEKSLLALKVNGADLSLDHGFPARIIIPAGPGVHNTKWVRRMTFTPA